jgi:hypothetical protein
MFDVRRSSVSFSIKLAASMAGPGLNSKQISFFFDLTGFSVASGGADT